MTLEAYIFVSIVILAFAGLLGAGLAERRSKVEWEE